MTAQDAWGSGLLPVCLHILRVPSVLLQRHCAGKQLLSAAHTACPSKAAGMTCCNFQQQQQPTTRCLVHTFLRNKNADVAVYLVTASHCSCSLSFLDPTAIHRAPPPPPPGGGMHEVA